MIEYIQIPTHCPYCDSELKIINNNGVKVLKCINNNCNAKLVNIINHFCSKNHGLNIKGLSKATIEKLINCGWLNSKSDIFKLSQFKKEWSNIPGFGEKSVSNIIESIEASKNTSLDKFIASLGIPLIGNRISKILAREFKTWDKFREAILDEEYNFYSLDGFGYEMNKSLKDYDYSEADEIAKLLNFASEETEVTKETLKGMTIVITGKLQEYKRRDDLKAEIEALGGKVSGSISSKTDYLINNDINSTTGKNKAAKEKGVAIISEKEFIKKFLKK